MKHSVATGHGPHEVSPPPVGLPSTSWTSSHDTGTSLPLPQFKDLPDYKNVHIMEPSPNPNLYHGPSPFGVLPQ